LFVTPFLCGTLDSAQAFRTRFEVKSPLRVDQSWKRWDKHFENRKELSIEDQLDFFKDNKKTLGETIKNVPKELFNNVLIQGLKYLVLDVKLSKKILSKKFLKNIDYINQTIADFLWNTAVHSHKSFNGYDNQYRNPDCHDYLKNCNDGVAVEILKDVNYDKYFVEQLLEECSKKIENKKRKKCVLSNLEIFKDILSFAKILMDSCEEGRVQTNNGQNRGEGSTNPDSVLGNVLGKRGALDVSSDEPVRGNPKRRRVIED
jgi:hypothetical protein